MLQKEWRNRVPECTRNCSVFCVKVVGWLDQLGVEGINQSALPRTGSSPLLGDTSELDNEERRAINTLQLVKWKNCLMSHDKTEVNTSDWVMNSRMSSPSHLCTCITAWKNTYLGSLTETVIMSGCTCCNINNLCYMLACNVREIHKAGKEWHLQGRQCLVVCVSSGYLTDF